MKSVELKFNEALAELKKKATASKYDDVCKEYAKLPTIEAKLNCVEAALTVKESASLGLTDIDEAKRDPAVAVLFGVEPKTTTAKKESTTIKKHNGAVENFVEGSPFNGDRSKATGGETNVRKDNGAKTTADGLLKAGKITEAEHAKLVGKKSAEYEALSGQQRKDFDFARLIGISEADAFKVARMAGSNFREVSRR